MIEVFSRKKEDKLVTLNKMEDKLLDKPFARLLLIAQEPRKGLSEAVTGHFGNVSKNVTQPAFDQNSSYSTQEWTLVAVKYVNEPNDCLICLFTIRGGIIEKISHLSYVK